MGIVSLSMIRSISYCLNTFKNISSKLKAYLCLLVYHSLEEVLLSSKKLSEFLFVLQDQVYFLFSLTFLYSMTIVDAYDENTKALRTRSAQEIKYLWDFHVRGCRDTLTHAHFDHIVKEACGLILSKSNELRSQFHRRGGDN